MILDNQNTLGMAFDALKLSSMKATGGKSGHFLPIKIQNLLRMPPNTLKLSLMKTAGGEARQVLIIKILMKCQKCFEDVLGDDRQRQSQTIVNGLRMAKMPHSCA